MKPRARGKGKGKRKRRMHEFGLILLTWGFYHAAILSAWSIPTLTISNTQKELDVTGLVIESLTGFNRHVQVREWVSLEGECGDGGCNDVAGEDHLKERGKWESVQSPLHHCGLHILTHAVQRPTSTTASSPSLSTHLH